MRYLAILAENGENELAAFISVVFQDDPRWDEHLREIEEVILAHRCLECLLRQTCPARVDYDETWDGPPLFTMEEAFMAVVDERHALNYIPTEGSVVPRFTILFADEAEWLRFKGELPADYKESLRVADLLGAAEAVFDKGDERLALVREMHQLHVDFLEKWPKRVVVGYIGLSELEVLFRSLYEYEQFMKVCEVYVATFPNAPNLDFLQVAIVVFGRGDDRLSSIQEFISDIATWPDWPRACPYESDDGPIHVVFHSEEEWVSFDQYRAEIGGPSLIGAAQFMFGPDDPRTEDVIKQVTLARIASGESFLLVVGTDPEKD